MSYLQDLPVLVISALLFYHLAFAIALIRKDYSVIDVVWPLSFLLIFSVGLVQQGGAFTTLTMAVGGLVALWSLRLAAYLLYRNLKQPEEDFRYAEMRADWQPNANLHAYFKVFLLQAMLALFIASPVYLIHFAATSSQNQVWNGLNYLGLAVAVIGFLWEAIADYQKDRFKADPANQGKPCRRGFWYFSRHPNYFGESVFWWGVFLLVIPHVSPLYAFFPPLLLQLFLLKVSGVNLLTKRNAGNPAYAEYQATTNALLPWWPKSK